MRYSLIFFDLDGTLADTADDIADSMERVLRREGLAAVPREKVFSSIGRGVRRLIEQCLEGQDEKVVIHVLEAFRKDYTVHLLDRTRLFEGVFEALNVIHSAPKILASNKPEQMCHKVLEGLQIADHFPLVFGGDTLPSRKPDPAVILQGLEKYKIEPAQAILVGDSGVDRETARAAGINFCAATYGYHRPGELDGSQYQIDRFPQLLSLLQA